MCWNTVLYLRYHIYLEENIFYRRQYRTIYATIYCLLRTIFGPHQTFCHDDLLYSHIIISIIVIQPKIRTQLSLGDGNHLVSGLDLTSSYKQKLSKCTCSSIYVTNTQRLLPRTKILRKNRCSSSPECQLRGEILFLAVPVGVCYPTNLQREYNTYFFA